MKCRSDERMRRNPATRICEKRRYFNTTEPYIMTGHVYLCGVIYARWSALMISPLLGVPGFPGMWKLVLNVSMQWCMCVCVCAFLLCHNDDVAVATMRTGASARVPSAMLNICASQRPAEKLCTTGASG